MILRLKTLSLCAALAVAAPFVHADTLTGTVSFSGAQQFVTGLPTGTLTPNATNPTGIVFSFASTLTASSPISEQVVGTIPSGATVDGLSLGQIVQFGQTPVAGSPNEFYFSLIIPVSGEILFTTPSTTFTVFSQTFIPTGTGGNLNPALYLYGTLVDTNFPAGANTVSMMLNLTDNFGSLNAGLDTGISNLTSTTSNLAPEPSSLVLLGTGLIGVAGLARRRFRN